jgi:hypothetical protein
MQFVSLRSPRGYTELKKTICDFGKSQEISEEGNLRPGRWKSPLTNSSLDSRIESLTAQLSDLTLIVKKTMDAGAEVSSGKVRTCSYCKKEGHFIGRCDLNPDKDTQCAKCKIFGHRAENCWSSKKQESDHKSEHANIVQEDGSYPKQNSQDYTMMITEEDIIVADKRDQNGEPLQKAARTDQRMSIPNLTKQEEPNTQKRKRRNVKSKHGKFCDLSRGVDKYNLLNEISQAHTGLTFGLTCPR